MVDMKTVQRWKLIVVMVGAMLVATGTEASSATDVLKRVSEAMGANALNTLRYSDAGTGYTFGQSYTPGTAWPKITIHAQTRTIDYGTGSMRDEITLSRAEPRGGGGYPPVAQQKNEQFVSGTFAWNQTAGGPVAGPRFVNDRIHQLWITPHGAIKAALRNKATLVGGGANGRGPAMVAFTEPGRFVASVFINADNLVERIESRFPDPVMGETNAVTRYLDYKRHGPIMFPSRVEQSAGGFPVVEVTVSDVQPNVTAGLSVPDAVRNAVENVAVERVADGVWFLGGGSHNSIAIEMSDYMIVVESPLNDGRAVPMFEQALKLGSGKPIRYLINSHQHFDHSGGVRMAAALGMTIVTHAGNVGWYEKTFAVANSIAPDAFARTGRKARFVGVDDKLVINDGARSVEMYPFVGSAHNDAFLMVYLPREQLLVEADAFTPGPAISSPNTSAPPNPSHVNLIDNIERLKLAVDKILPLHGRVVGVDQLYMAVGKPSPR